MFKAHKDLVEGFRHKIWDYYKELTAYKSNPDEKEKKRLNEAFDKLFSVKTGYVTLDECIAKTMERKSG
ncbi:MAG: transposase, partial [bacterium]